jgi:DNA-directed RNA polymerase subunit RPC12/RpoP
VFTVLKNFNFADYRNSPILTTNQVSFIWAFLLIGLTGIVVFLSHGYFVKTPKFYTRAGAAVIFIVIGLFIVFSMLLHDLLTGKDTRLNWLEMTGLVFGSLITIAGSYGYLSLKFPDEAVMKYFKEAVKEEIRNRREEERQWQLQQAQIKKAEKKVKVKEFKVKKKKEKVEVEPVLDVQEVVMSPPEEAGITVVKCSKCQRELKLTSPERPLTIKCPYCEEVGVIKE